MLNVKLLLKIKQHILAEPRRLLMSDWIVRGPKGSCYTDDRGNWVKFAKCNTAACIAGWAVILGKKKPTERDYDSAYEVAAKLLGMKDGADLFFESHWGAVLEEEYHAAKTPSERAKIAAKAIDNYIAADKVKQQLRSGGK